MISTSVKNTKQQNQRSCKSRSREILHAGRVFFEAIRKFVQPLKDRYKIKVCFFILPCLT